MSTATGIDEAQVNVEDLPMEFKCTQAYRYRPDKIYEVSTHEFHGHYRNNTELVIGHLPEEYRQVKYVGCEVSRGLWGIKYTRRPVDIMVGVAKNLPPNKVLPHCNLKVSTSGVNVDIIAPKASINNWNYPIDTISYGVQDLVYTRIFAMIVVKDSNSPHPFEVHAFVCDNRATARKLTFALAAAFQDYSRRVKENGEGHTDNITPTRQKFAIDLRSPEELQENLEEETEA